jgi:hypothetical protein
METANSKSYLTNGLIALYGACIVLCVGYEFKVIPQDFLVFKSEPNINNNAPVNTPVIEDKVAEKVKEKIDGKEYSNTDDYDYPYIIQFDPVQDKGDGIMGAMTLSHTNRPTMGDDAQSIGKSCNYYFTYTVRGNSIVATFTSSDCGGTSPNMILTYDNGSGYIVMKSGKGGLVFKPMN